MQGDPWPHQLLSHATSGKTINLCGPRSSHLSDGGANNTAKIITSPYRAGIDLKTMIERHLAGRYLKVVFFLFYGGITFKISKICVVALLVISPYVDISQQIVMVSDNFQRNMYKLDRFLLVTEQALPQVVIPQEKMTKSESKLECPNKNWNENVIFVLLGKHTFS